MGGLLARVYIAKYRPSRLGRVVMLGTPKGGSEIADRLKNVSPYRAFFGPAGQQLGTMRDAATGALLPPVDYPVGIIAGDRSLDPMASLFLAKPHDGRVSVENTRLDGMADHIVIHIASVVAANRGDCTMRLRRWRSARYGSRRSPRDDRHPTIGSPHHQRHAADRLAVDQQPHRLRVIFQRQAMRDVGRILPASAHSSSALIRPRRAPDFSAPPRRRARRARWRP